MREDTAPSADRQGSEFVLKIGARTVPFDFQDGTGVLLGTVEGEEVHLVRQTKERDRYWLLSWPPSESEGM